VEVETIDEAVGVAIGERLRAIRRQKHWSLHDVETQSEHEFKASVLGAYERGERAISVPRLLRLAELYGVPADQLLPEPAVTISLAEGTSELAGGFTLDLVALQAIEAEEAAILERFVQAIQRQRQDFNGRMLTIRQTDLRLLAAVFGTSPDELAGRLTELGLRATRTPRPV
jgi:transcriptional regulator with XRE-family HTH domain